MQLRLPAAFQVQRLRAFVLQYELKINGIGACPDFVDHHSVWLDSVTEAKMFGFGCDQLCPVPQNRLAPVAICRAFGAKGFQIQDLQFSAWQRGTENGQPVIGPVQRQAILGIRPNGSATKQSTEERPIFHLFVRLHLVAVYATEDMVLPQMKRVFRR